jgi:integrase
MYRNQHKFFGPVNLDAITPERVEAFQDHRVVQVSPATVNRECALLKHMFNMADRWDLYRGRNPVKLVKFLREDNLQFQTLSETEERALLACCPSYLQDMIVFALNTGLRCGDIFKLQWEEVDFEQRRLVFLVQKTSKLLKLPLNDSAYSVLQAWQAIGKGPYVFYNQMTGDRFRDVKNGLKKACQQAQIKHTTWHVFRHTFASRLVRDGVDIVTVKELMGHSTVLVTMRYAHTNEEAKIQAVMTIKGCDRPVTVTPKPRRTRQ